MDTAERFAQLSSAKRAKVGAIIVKDNRIISIGYNGMPSGWDNTCEVEVRSALEPGKKMILSKLQTKPEVLHAETNAIAKVAQSNDNCKDATLFCTHEPCIECAKLIYQAGITTLIFKHSYNADKGRGGEFLLQSGINVEQLDQLKQIV